MNKLEEEARRKSLEDLMNAMTEDDLRRSPKFSDSLAPEQLMGEGEEDDCLGDVQDPRLLDLLKRKKASMGA